MGGIEAVGKDVILFKKGAQVFAVTGPDFSSYAEYRSMPEKGAVALKPANMIYEETATVPTGGLSALHFLRKGNILGGEKVLINGAAGSIGTVEVQFAKHDGADVTGVDSKKKLDMLNAIGANHVIDYTQEDFTISGETYNIIFDVAGKRSFSRSVRSLNRNGHYILANPSLSLLVRGLWTSMTNSKKVITGLAPEKTEGLIFLKELIEAETIKTVIDRRYPLEQIAEAHSYVEPGQKAGDVVIRGARQRNLTRRNTVSGSTVSRLKPVVGSDAGRRAGRPPSACRLRRFRVWADRPASPLPGL